MRNNDDVWEADYDGVLVKRASAASRRLAEPGALISGKGVFVGVWAPRGCGGNSLGRTFNLFAAPHDLGLDEQGQGRKLVVTYDDAVKAVGTITNLMGHAGGKYKNDAELCDALRSGSYKGEWFIPPRDLLNGEDLNGNKLQNANLYQYRGAGKFVDTFTTASGSGLAHWYWSCSEPRGNPFCVWDVAFTDGLGAWDLKDVNSLSARVVRAELRP